MRHARTRPRTEPHIQILSGGTSSSRCQPCRRAGEVVGLIGENGAGKSTLMRILGGVTAPSSGVIKLRGEQKDNLTVSEAIRCGIAFVHQELNLFDKLDVAANVFFGREKLSFGLFQLI